MKYWIGQASHKDDIDGYEFFLILPNDISLDDCNEIIMEARQNDWNIWSVTHRCERSVFDGIANAIKQGRDKYSVGHGFLIDLAEPYEMA